MDATPNNKAGDLEVTGVSRSGRVRKKSSKLMDFQSPDDVDAKLKRVPVSHKSPNIKSNTSINNLQVAGNTIKKESGQNQIIPVRIDTSDTENELNESNIDSQMDTDDDLNKEMDEENILDPKPSKSIYIMEKSSKKKILKDGKVILTKAQRKDKGKSRFTAYMLWAKDVRQEMAYTHPELDFAMISRRLGEMWANVPNNEKYNWRRRAKRLASTKGKDLQKRSGAAKTNTKNSKFLNKNTTASQTKKSPHVDKNSKNHETTHSPNNVSQKSTSASLYKVNSSQPADVAAHLKLLGDSLTIIGERLKEHEGQIAVSGSLSVLLDSLLCSIGPLMCLTRHIPGFGPKVSHLQDTLHNTLDNIAYVMPGL